MSLYTLVYIHHGTRHTDNLATLHQNIDHVCLFVPVFLCLCTYLYVCVRAQCLIYALFYCPLYVNFLLAGILRGCIAMGCKYSTDVAVGISKF